MFQFVYKIIIRIYKSFDVKKILKGQITFWSAVSHGFLGTLSKSMITAVESDHDTDDNTNPTSNSKTKNKTKKTPSHYSSIENSQI